MALVVPTCDSATEYRKPTESESSLPAKTGSGTHLRSSRPSESVSESAHMDWASAASRFSTTGVTARVK